MLTDLFSHFKNKKYFKQLFFIVLVLIFFYISSNINNIVIPLTGENVSRDKDNRTQNIPGLLEFQNDLDLTDPNFIAGLYIPEILAAPVVQQASGEPAYVSTKVNTITQFNIAKRYGTIGLLAHNYLAGKSFLDLEPGQLIILVYGNKEIERYQISEIEEYKALSPQDPYSSFININNPTKILSSTDLFQNIYRGRDKLVLQTCIEANNNNSWGRLFVIAEKLD